MRACHVMVVSLFLASACSTDEEEASESLARRACERIDECNALPDGKSVEDCTQQGQKNFDDLAPGARADQEKLVEGCLEFQTCDRFLSCLLDDSGSTPPGDDPAAGQFALGWAITLNGVGSTCGEVGLDELRLTSTGPTGTFVDRWPCEAYRGTTQPLPAGAYSLVLSLHRDGGTEIDRTPPASFTLAAGQTLDLGSQNLAFR